MKWYRYSQQKLKFYGKDSVTTAMSIYSYR